MAAHEMSSKTYLITGGAGNLACQLAIELVRRSHQVVLFDVVEQSAATLPDNCLYVRGDIARRDDLVDALTEYDPNVIIHFASLLSGSSEQNRELAWRVNMDGAWGMFEAAIEHRVEQVLFPSSVAAYGGRLPNPLPEDFPQWPDGLYGVTKVAVERLGVYYHRRHGLDFRCIRVPIVLSTFAHAGAASSYASRAFVEAVHKGRFTFKVNPQTRPSLIYVKDALQAMLDLLDAPANRLTRRVYNIHAIAPTARQLADVIAARLPDAEFAFEPDPQLVALVESWPIEIDDASARSDWNWHPRYPLDELTDDLIRQLQDETACPSGI